MRKYSLQYQFVGEGKREKEAFVISEDFVRASSTAEMPLIRPGTRPRESQLVSKRQELEGSNGSNTHSADISVADIEQIFSKLGGVHYYRWTPRNLAIPAALDHSRRYRMHETGFGLARCLDEILSFNRGRFMKLEEAFFRIFPHVEEIRLTSEPAFGIANEDGPVLQLNRAEGKGIAFKLKGISRPVPASQVTCPHFLYQGL